MLLIFPPVAKPCEPPAGIAKLAAALASHGLPCDVADMNLEALLFLLGRDVEASDTWSRRAIKNSSRDLAALRDPGTYRSRDRYSRAVTDLSRVLELSGRGLGVIAGLADYHDAKLSPVRSADLIEAAGHPEQNLFYPYFSNGLPEIVGRLFGMRECGAAEEKAGSPGRTSKGGGGIAIGFSLNYLSQALTTFAMIGFIRKEFPGIRIVLGGGLVTSWMKRPGWKDPFQGLVDHLVAGPGEGPLLSLSASTLPDSMPVPPDYTSLPMGDYLSPGFVLPYAGIERLLLEQMFLLSRTRGGQSLPSVSCSSGDGRVEFADRDRPDPVLVHLLDNAVSPALMRGLAEAPPGVPWYGFARIGRELAGPGFLHGAQKVRVRHAETGAGVRRPGRARQDGEGDRSRDRFAGATEPAGRPGSPPMFISCSARPSETITEARRTLDFVVRHHEAITFLNLAVFNLPICSKEAGLYPTAALLRRGPFPVQGFPASPGLGPKAGAAVPGQRVQEASGRFRDPQERPACFSPRTTPPSSRSPAKEARARPAGQSF